MQHVHELVRRFRGAKASDQGRGCCTTHTIVTNDQRKLLKDAPC